MSNGNLRQHTREAPTDLGCVEVEGLLGPLVEGLLGFRMTVQVLDHMHDCKHCEQLLLEFRKFVLDDPPEPTVKQKELPEIAAPVSPLWVQWQDRLQRWLDVVFPGTVMTPVYRGAAAGMSEAPGWERAARRQAEHPLLNVQEGEFMVTLHVARGLVFGRVGYMNGEPLYPALLSLAGEDVHDSVLTQPDGTFQLRWNPEARRLECQSPLGVVTRFALPSGE